MQRNGDMSPEFEMLHSVVFGILDKGRQKIIGTGFFITIDGVALTSSHVVSEYSMYDSISTTLPNDGVASFVRWDSLRIQFCFDKRTGNGLF